MPKKPTNQQFGGAWTIEKLNKIQKYLSAYVLVFKKQDWVRTFYVDAFAGAGYNTLKQDNDPTKLMLPEFEEQDAQNFLESSVRKALEVEPQFDTYIFIEKSQKRFNDLLKIKEEFPNHDIDVLKTDANSYVQSFCSKMQNNHRAVLFLDPFGMQVPWQTIKAIAETEKIDLWYLFPLGVAVDRLLKRDGNIDEKLRVRLDELFGASDWYEEFYRTETREDLFGDLLTSKTKTANVEAISKYFVQRLETIFAGVAQKPLVLRNSRQRALYILCFAVSNPSPKAREAALKIANSVLAK